MMVTWALFTIWVLLHLVDIAISWVAVQSGASEIGLLYRISRSWLSLMISKMVLALIGGGILVYVRKDSWLALLTLGMVGLCIYNGWVLLQQITG